MKGFTNAGCLPIDLSEKSVFSEYLPIGFTVSPVVKKKNLIMYEGNS